MLSKPLEAETVVISGLLQLVDFHQRGDGDSDFLFSSAVGPSDLLSAHFLLSHRSCVGSFRC